MWNVPWRKKVVTEKKKEEETKTIDTAVSINAITPETPHETLRKLKYELKTWEIEKQKQYDQDETFRKKMNAVHFNRSHFVSWLTRTSDEALLFIKAKSMKWKNLKDKEKYEEKIRFNETELAYKHLQHGGRTICCVRYSSILRWHYGKGRIPSCFMTVREAIEVFTPVRTQICCFLCGTDFRTLNDFVTNRCILVVFNRVLKYAP